MRKTLLALAVVLAGAATARAEEKGFTFTTGGGPRLGVQITLLTDELRTYFGAQKDAGVLVGKIEPGGAADKAGVKIGDVLVNVGGAAIDDAGDVRRALADHKEGDTVPLTVVREHRPLTLAVRVPKAEPPPQGMLPGPEMNGMDSFPRDGMRMYRLDNLDRRLEQIEERLRKLETR